MKNVTYFFILFLLILTPPLFADKNSNEEVLKRLDRIIDNKTAYHVQKEKEIVDLKQRLHRSKDNREKYELCGSLFNAYLHYQADSALYYINGKMNLLPLLNHPELKNEIVINRAEVMGVMGMYNEALEQSEQKVVDLDFSKKKTEPNKLTSEDLTFTKEEESVIREVIQEYLG